MNNPRPSITPRLSALLVALALYGAGALQPALAEEAGVAAAETPAPAAAVAPEATAPEAAATEGSADEAAPDEAATAQMQSPVRRSYGYRAEQNRRIAQIREAARQRRENMERWRSARRWWHNPAAEQRRLWNKARSEWYREMAEARREQLEQLRPEPGYRHRYWRGYP